jgi:alkylated DNA repair dioxygenase AlkB
VVSISEPTSANGEVVRLLALDLFNLLLDPPISILPKDGSAHYHGVVFSEEETEHYLQNLLAEVAWYADQPFDYTYSKVTRTALPWTSNLLDLKNKVEEVSGETFNSCLLNLYHSGEEGMSWHSDSEKQLKRNGAIASISLGAERKFCFKHKQTKETHCSVLQHGSLLVMKGVTQTHWLHRLPPTKKVKQIRVNLTFRTVVTK